MTLTPVPGAAERGWELIAHYASRHDHDTRDDDGHRAVTVELIVDVLRAVERFTGWNTAEVHAEALEIFRHDV
jgi:hypothetical protein